jgi:hypothetical protein
MLDVLITGGGVHDGTGGGPRISAMYSPGLPKKGPAPMGRG